MNTYQIITLFAILLRFGDIDANKFNISLSHLDNCKEYAIISEDYKYKNFFQINSMNSSKLEDNQKLHLKFFVMAPRDAFILLTEFENHTNSERFYEINFGGNDNSRSSMYEKGKGVDKQIVLLTTPNLLSTFDPMPIEIIQTNGGHLIVHIPGFLEFFISYKDSNPLNIRFFSFSSWAESSAKWYYDCTLEEMKDQKMSENEVKTVETCVNEQQLSEHPKSTAKPTEKNYEEQLTSKLSAIDPCMIKLKEYFWSETGPFNKHNSFFIDLFPILDNFDVNQMLDFKVEVLELIKKLKNTPTTTAEEPKAIDVRIGDSEKSSCSCS